MPGDGPAREELDHTGHGLRAVEHTGRATYDLDPLDIVERDATKIEHATRFIERHAVEKHAHVVGLPAAHEERRLRAERRTPCDRNAGNALQRVSEVRHALGAEDLAVEHGGGGGGRGECARHAGRRHDLGGELNGAALLRDDEQRCRSECDQ